MNNNNLTVSITTTSLSNFLIGKVFNSFSDSKIFSKIFLFKCQVRDAIMNSWNVPMQKFPLQH